MTQAEDNPQDGKQVNNEEIKSETKFSKEDLRWCLDFQDKSLNKTLDIFKFSVGTFISLLGLSVVLLGFLNWKYRDDLEKDIDRRLAKLDAKPDLEILTKARQPLENQKIYITRIIATNRDNQGQPLPTTQTRYIFPLVLKNNGDGGINYIRYKILNKHFSLQIPSSDNSKYPFEDTITISDSGREGGIPWMEGKSSRTSISSITSEQNKPLANGQYRLPDGEYPVMLMVIHPSNKIIEHEFFLVIDKNTEYISYRK